LERFIGRWIGDLSTIVAVHFNDLADEIWRVEDIGKSLRGKMPSLQ